MAAATVQVFVCVHYTIVNGCDGITASEGVEQVFGVVVSVAFQKFRLPVSVYDDRTQHSDSDVIEVTAFDFARCHSCRSVSGVFGRPLRGIQ